MDAQKMAGLAGLVDGIDAEAPPSPEQLAEQQQQAQAEQAQQTQQADAEQQARQWGAIPYMVGGVLAMAAPELRQVYTQQNCMDWGRAMVPVAGKYGWNDAGKLPELGLAIATLGFAIPSVLAIRAAVAAQKGGWLGQVQTWWLRRKAKKAGQPAPAGEGASGGGQP